MQVLQVVKHTLGRIAYEWHGFFLPIHSRYEAQQPQYEQAQRDEAGTPEHHAPEHTVQCTECKADDIQKQSLPKVVTCQAAPVIIIHGKVSYQPAYNGQVTDYGNRLGVCLPGCVLIL